MLTENMRKAHTVFLEEIFFFSCMFHNKMLQCIVVCFDLTGEILVWNFSGLRNNNLFWLLEIFFFLPCPCFLVSL